MSKYLRIALTIGLLSGCAWLPKPSPGPSPILDHHLQVYVQDSLDHSPLLTASVRRGDDMSVHVGGDGGVAWRILEAGFELCASAPTYVGACVRVDQFEDQSLTIQLTQVPPSPTPDPEPVPPPDITPIAYPPTALAPLLALPTIMDDGREYGFWSHTAYSTVLPFDPPDLPDPAFFRGDFGLIDVPECNLPATPGGFDGRPAQIMSWFLPQYSDAQQVCILQGHQRRGYTHYNTYMPWSKSNGVSDVAYESALKRIKRAGFWNVVTVYGGDGEPWEYIQSRLDALYAAGVLVAGDTVVTCWQCNGKMEPYPLAELTVRLSNWAHPKGLYVAQHWYAGTVAWWNAKDDGRRPSTCYNANNLGLPNFCDRFQFGRAMTGVVDFQLAQFDPWAPIEDDRPRTGGIAGEARDHHEALSGQCMVAAEYDAQRRADQPSVSEWEGNAKGFILLAVRGRDGSPVFRCGFLGGARLPNGEWIH